MEDGTGDYYLINEHGAFVLRSKTLQEGLRDGWMVPEVVLVMDGKWEPFDATGAIVYVRDPSSIMKVVIVPPNKNPIVFFG